MFRKKSSESSSIDKEYMEPDVVVELYEEGSAMLSERFNFVISVVEVSSTLVFLLTIECLSKMQVRNKISTMQHVQVVHMCSMSSRNKTRRGYFST